MTSIARARSLCNSASKASRSGGLPNHGYTIWSKYEQCEADRRQGPQQVEKRETIHND